LRNRSNSKKAYEDKSENELANSRLKGSHCWKTCGHLLSHETVSLKPGISSNILLNLTLVAGVVHDSCARQKLMSSVRCGGEGRARGIKAKIHVDLLMSIIQICLINVTIGYFT
jgi:hypothetical protein